ncbi:MAG TPA: hypothetical protein PLF88_05875 [Opitutaceae bacterium]|jgi:hypothetical protein|nr:hypothetical protein [Opitutaceae bacterium]HRJ47747.1 hypothetical protein [Opitutaceae bacterium]
MIRRVLPGLVFLVGASWLAAQDFSALHGRVEGNTYHGANGTYAITMPVLPELGGIISDTPSVVVFRDQFNVHISIGSFPQDASQRWELSTRGLRDYLQYYFVNFVFPDFQQLFAGSRIESSNFEPDTMGGALVIYTLLPGGTMFFHRRVNIGPENPERDAKRGNLLFIRHNHIFVISIELAERVVEGSAYNLTPEQENTILRQRLEHTLENLFIKRPTDAAR